MTGIRSLLAAAFCVPLLCLGINAPAHADTAAVAGAAAEAGSDLTSELPGPTEILGAASAILDFISLCQENEKAGLPCTQSTAETVDEIYTTVTQTYSLLQSFVTQSEANQQQILNDLGTIFSSEAYNDFENEWNGVRNDLQNSYTGILIYQGLLDCLTNLPATATDPAGTCTTYNTSRIAQPNQPATAATISGVVSTLTTFVNGTQWNNTPVNMASNIGGNFSIPTAGAAVNPFVATNGTAEPTVLGTLVEYQLAQEAAKQGLQVGSSISYFPASLVNNLGAAVTEIVSLEAQYFNLQVIAGYLSATSTQSNSYTNAQGFAQLAQNGTTGPQGILSLSQQLATYTFPGWTPTNQLSNNQGYLVGSSFGAVLLTNNGSSESTPSSDQGLPTTAQLEQIGQVLGPQYAEIAKLYPDALPSSPSAEWGNLGATSDTSVGRWWTVPQATWNAGLVNTGPLGPFYEREPSCGKTGFACPNWLLINQKTKPYPVTLLANTTTFYISNSEGNNVYWNAPAITDPVNQSIPYSIYSATQTPSAPSEPFYSFAQVSVADDVFGEAVTPQSVAQYTKSTLLETPPSQLYVKGNMYDGSFTMPTWDVYWDGPTMPPFTYGTVGTFVKFDGVSATNMATSFTQPTGVLQVAATSS